MIRAIAVAIALLAPLATSAQDRAAALKGFDAEIRKYLDFSEKVKIAVAKDVSSARTDIAVFETFKIAHTYHDNMLSKVEAVAIPAALTTYKQQLEDARNAAANVLVARLRGYKVGMAYADDKKSSQLSAIGDHIARSDVYAKKYGASIDDLKRAVSK